MELSPVKDPSVTQDKSSWISCLSCQNTETRGNFLAVETSSRGVLLPPVVLRCGFWSPRHYFNRLGTTLTPCTSLGSRF